MQRNRHPEDRTTRDLCTLEVSLERWLAFDEGHNQIFVMTVPRTKGYLPFISTTDTYPVVRILATLPPE